MTPDTASLVARLMGDAMSALEPRLTGAEARDAQDYLDHGEYGVAWELLWHIAGEDALEPPPALIDAGRAMGLKAAEQAR